MKVSLWKLTSQFEKNGIMKLDLSLIKIKVYCMFHTWTRVWLSSLSPKSAIYFPRIWALSTSIDSIRIVSSESQLQSSPSKVRRFRMTLAWLSFDSRDIVWTAKERAETLNCFKIKWAPIEWELQKYDKWSVHFKNKWFIKIFFHQYSIVICQKQILWVKERGKNDIFI